MADIQKKYQVFVSSTYEDMQLERKEVIHALLELDCIPSGMELFPAADEDQWSLIKGVIDDCDYYVVIVGGRYGSIGKEAMSYTEMEYRYALEKGKPVIGFLHKDPESLPKNRCEKSQEGQKKLEEFRRFVQNKMCKYWEDAKDLGSVVSRSLISLQKKHPGIGWVRGNTPMSKDAQIEILRLRQELDALKKTTQLTNNTLKDNNIYAQGEDKFSINYDFQSTDEQGKEHPWDHSTIVTWDEIFYWILPIMMDKASDTKLKSSLSDFLSEKCKDKYKKDKDIKNHDLDNFEIFENDYHTIMIQALALGYIRRFETKKYSDDEEDRHWILTPIGEEIMFRLRAVKRKVNKSKKK